MPTKIKSPSIIKAAGNKPKVIEEFIGRVNSNTDKVSIARMKSPAGWVEPGQRPEFDEYTILLKGELHIKTESDELIFNGRRSSNYKERGMDSIQFTLS